MTRARRFILPTLLLALACCTVLTTATASAATLHAGDVLVLGRYPVGSALPQAIFVVAPGTRNVQTIDLNPALTDMQDLVIRNDGEILVSDGVEGLVSVSAVDGTWQPRFAPSAFGGTAPSALTLAPNGDLIAAGMFGIMRLAGATGSPQQVSTVSFALPPRGLATDGGANIYVASDEILRIDAGTGAATPVRTCCPGDPLVPSYLTLGTLHLGPDGFLYVVTSPGGGGPSARANNSVSRVDLATGYGTRVLGGGYLFSFAFDATGTLWVCSADNISLSPYGGWIEADGIRTTLYNRGPVAIVPPGVTTPARRASWGAIKQHAY